MRASASSSADRLLENWDHPRNADVIAKVVGDFCGWDRDATKYADSFERLLRGLQGETADKEGEPHA